MKKLVVLTLATLLGIQQGHTQFSKTVKDSVLSLLSYPSARYTVSFNINTEDYTTDTTLDLNTLTRQQLQEKRKGHYTDASICQALAAKSWYEDNNQQEATQLLAEASEKYRQWINAEPENPTPITELMNMCINSRNYPPIPDILAYALPLFPKHLPLLQKAIYYEQFIAKRYDRCQELYNQVRAIDSFDLTTLVYQSGLMALQQVEAMQQKKEIVFTAIPGLKTAIEGRLADHTGLTHLYHYHQLFYLYMKIAAHAMTVESSSPNLFDFYTLTPQEKQQVEEAENWMKRQLALKGKNVVQLLNSLAVIQCMKKDYPAAIAYYDQAYQISKGASVREGKILCYMFIDAYPEVEKLLKEKLAAQNSIADYGSLLMVYSKYTKKKEAELALLQQLQALPDNDALRRQILATGYLKTGQPALLPGVLSSLGEADRDDLLIQLVAAILNDRNSSAAVYLNKLLHLDPEDKAGLAIKRLTLL
jgi:tetratricopeptide (TPR) repeat protein